MLIKYNKRKTYILIFSLSITTSNHIICLLAYIRSCKEEYLVPVGMMQNRIKAIAVKHGLDDTSPEVAGLLSHALHERIKTIVEKLAVIAQHRIDALVKVKTNFNITFVSFF